ncbi:MULTISPECIES: 4-(cytidine 5'-diphospho)-2-C-methyl-D-erythritol kinase [Falsihalocynthiibacter]|uniref:4-(cytidine 5'-diphospho)-2-C-methyl-D-erythritol kinase n=1 Tax=Falsihalocynthiibacter TaxID=2854182 RepID=UPI003001DDDE
MEFAPAKINLTLHVTGRRADGYHLLDSLVVFADIGDYVGATNSDILSLAVEGPEGAGLAKEKDNLVLRAARLLNPGQPVALTLQKNLPTASGIGGGSADAAATLRLLARHWALPLPKSSDVLQLGADVPVCLSSTTARMQGIGEVLTAVPKLPDMALLLINPRQSVATPDIFKALENSHNTAMDDVPDCSSLDEFCRWLAHQRNDLQAPAIAVQPVISRVLEAISQTGALLSRMSGSGATCFGVFPDSAAASKAAEKISEAYPTWWAKSARILE